MVHRTLHTAQQTLQIFHNSGSCCIDCGNRLLGRSEGIRRLRIALLVAVAECGCRVMIALLIVFIAQVKANKKNEWVVTTFWQ
jgi:hypothetical protein